MEILIAAALGVVAGILVKVLFLKDAALAWTAAFGAVGGIGAYYLQSALEADVAEAIFTVAIAVVIAGVLHELWNRFGRAGTA